MAAREVVIGLHLYQPPRRANHKELSDRSTDPNGVDWTKRIYHECYKPLLDRKVLDLASFDILGTLHRELEHIDHTGARKINRSLREQGIGEPYLHPILPDLSRVDKDILIGFGAHRFRQKANVDPQIFWPPETAIDSETLAVLVDNGYRGFICAPEQIIRSDGQRPDSRPTRINLEGGKSIIALPFDRPVSSDLAFHPKTNADEFVMSHILPALAGLGTDGRLLAWTDGETFGHHNKFGDLFLSYLLSHALQNKGIVPIPVNELLRKLQEPGIGKIRERTAWSCPHGDLIRWHGICSCGSGDLSWKSPLYSGLHKLNGSITQIVQSRLGDNYVHLLKQDFESILENKGGSRSSVDQSLLSAKASALAAVTSCATFYDSPHTSGRINALFALQSIKHLLDAGLIREAESARTILQTELKKSIAQLANSDAHNPFNDLLR